MRGKLAQENSGAKLVCCCKLSFCLVSRLFTLILQLRQSEIPELQINPVRLRQLSQMHQPLRAKF